MATQGKRISAAGLCALFLLASCGGGDKPATQSGPETPASAAENPASMPSALSKPTTNEEPDLSGATVWDDPAGDASLGKDPRQPIDIVKAWAVVRGKDLCIGAKFKDPITEFWKKPNEQGEYRHRVFMEFYMNTDANNNTGGKAAPKGGKGFDAGIQCYASAKYKDKRSGEIKLGPIGAKAEEFEFLEPDFFFSIHDVPSSVGFGLGDRMYRNGPWSDSAIGSHFRKGRDWVEFDVPLDVIKIKTPNGITMAWMEAEGGAMSQEQVMP